MMQGQQKQLAELDMLLEEQEEEEAEPELENGGGELQYYWAAMCLLALFNIETLEVRDKHT